MTRKASYLFTSVLVLAFSTLGTIRAGRTRIQAFAYDLFPAATEQAEAYLPTPPPITPGLPLLEDQGAEYGVRVGYVGTSKGNLAFALRDLILPGPLPLRVGRTYDSSRNSLPDPADRFAGMDFGPGWRLTPGDFLIVSPGGERLTYDTASGPSYDWVRGTGGAFVMADTERLSRVKRIHTAPNGGFRGETRGGDMMLFEPAGGDGLYVLAELRDANGNWVRLEWSQDRLQGISNSAGESVVVVREPAARQAGIAPAPAGRVLELRGSAGRSVFFRYDEAGRLAESIAPGGVRTSWSYDATGRVD